MAIEGKVAIVTGASRGLGKATAFALADRGASVAIVGRSEEPGGRLAGTIRETADQIAERGGKALPVRTDVGNAEQVDALLEQILSELGGVDIVCSQRGGGHQGTCRGNTDAEMRTGLKRKHPRDRRAHHRFLPVYERARQR